LVGLRLETDGTKADLDRRLVPEKATEAGESFTAGNMAPADQQKEPFREIPGSK
jgi:hypothetical protein